MPSRGNAKRGRGGRRGGGASGKSSTSTPYGQGSKVQLDVCESNTARLATFVKNQSQLTHVDDTLSIFKEIVPTKLRGKALTFATESTILDWNPDSVQTPNQGTLTVQEKDLVKEVQAYKKTIALQDVYRWMRYNEKPVLPFNWSLQNSSVMEPENQGYIDAVASALASKLKAQYNSPHFCTFYGAFRAVCDTFKYNLEDDLEDFRFSRWFWSSIDSEVFTLCVTDKSSGRALSQEEIRNYLRPDDEYLQDCDSDDDDDDDDDDNDDADDDGDDTNDLDASSLEAETLDISPLELDACTLHTNLEESSGTELEETDVHYDTIPQIRRNSVSCATISTLSTTSSSISFTEEYNVHAEFKSMPAVIVFLEKLHGTMDSLLEQSELTPIRTKDQEQMWSAWIFQVCAALSQLQRIFQLTHNVILQNQ